MLVVDDALLFAVLARIAEPYLQVAVGQGEPFTTGSWYWRLSRALHDSSLTGAPSQAIDDLTAEQQARVSEFKSPLVPL
jgi:hypothetical protein